MVEPTRVFGGKRFICRLAFLSKKSATKEAEAQRQKGRLARVRYQKKHKVWQVWVH